MAQAKKPDPADSASFETINSEVNRRTKQAKLRKYQFLPDIAEAYSFVMPHRVPPGSSSDTKPMSASDNFSSLGEEVITDFASDMADTFIPEHTNWASVEVAASVPDELQEDAKVAAKKDSAATFGAIKASNFHETGKQAFKDLGVSAVGMAVNDPGAGQPIQCQVIPINELLMLRDATGGIGTRFWERSLTLSDIMALFPDVKRPPNVETAFLQQKWDAKFLVIQGCYRDYSVKAETAWISFTQIDMVIVEGARRVGVGAANILVARWDPDPNFEWGIGCAMKALADFRELDETNYLKLKGLARQIDPSVAYDDDSVINLEGGLPNGVAIPRMKGSQIDVIESSHDMNAAFFATKDVVDRIRRHFYQDGPSQEGKTPPTLGQWMDESLQKQRRLGTPAAPLWQEFLSEAYMRFRWLLVARGQLKAVIPVGKQFFPVRPINPLQRAAQQQEAVASEHLLSSLSAIFGPNLISAIVDVGETSHRMQVLSNATGVILQSAKTINDTITQNQQAIVAQQGAQAMRPLLAGAGG